MAILADTGFAYAVFDADDRYHAQATAYLLATSRMGEEILLPSVTLPELAYHVNQVGGGQLVADALMMVRRGRMTMIDLEAQDYDRTAEILRKYHDTRIDFVDACIMALAERLKITRILTFDRRDFGLFRPAHVEQFELLP